MIYRLTLRSKVLGDMCSTYTGGEDALAKIAADNHEGFNFTMFPATDAEVSEKHKALLLAVGSAHMAVVEAEKALKLAHKNIAEFQLIAGI